MPKIIFVILFILINSKISGQELNAQFLVNADLVNQTNQQIFETLERSLNEFINSQSWTNIEFYPQEKITCSFVLNLTSYNASRFEGTLQIQSQRTVFDSNYDSPILNYLDKDISFTYEEFFPTIKKTINGQQNIFWSENIKWFAQSSGTTNSRSKFIPVSNSSLDNCHFKGGKDMLCLYLNNNENSNMFLGKSLRLGGSRKIYENNDNYFGDLSAILIDNLPIWAELISTPNNEISLMDKLSLIHI